MVHRKRRIKAARRARVDAHRLDPEAGDGGMLGQPAGAGHRGTGSVRAAFVGVQKAPGVGVALAPAGAQQHPAVLRQRAVLGFPGREVLGFQQHVGIGGGLGAQVDHDRRADQPRRLDLMHRLAVFAGDPVNRGVEVGAGMFAQRDVAPGPGGPRRVEGADGLHLKGRGVGKRRGQLQHRGLLAQRRGQVNDAQAASGQLGHNILQGGHAALLERTASGGAVLTKGEALQFAGGGLGQGVAELGEARGLLGRDLAFDKLLQFGCEGLTGWLLRHKHHEGPHQLAAQLVEQPDHRAPATPGRRSSAAVTSGAAIL